MTLPITNQNVQGSFVPTTFLVDVARIQEVEVTSTEFKELLVRLYQNLNRMALSLNVKDSGYYPTNQFVTGQLYFPNGSTNTTGMGPSNYRPVTRMVVNFGALPNAGTKSVAHHIPFTFGVSFTHIFATATDPVNFLSLPLPYASATLNKNIELKVDATNVTVITAIDYSAYTLCYVVLEFITS